MAGFAYGVANVAAGAVARLACPLTAAACPTPTLAPAPGSVQHHYSGDQTICGNTQQSGNFKGHGTGASVEGGYSASGSHNSGDQTICGNTQQSGDFKGHGTGARIEGGFKASGSIS